MKRMQGRRARRGRRLATLASLAGALLAAAVAAPAQAAPGDLDPTFSGDGKQTTNLGFGSSEAAATVRQPNGKIVAVGAVGSFGGDFALARYNADGSLDTSFSGDGKQMTHFFSFSDRATGVALQDDGKIVVVGFGGVEAGGGGGDFALARYNPNGSLDTSFSGDGTQTTDFGFSDGAAGVALQDDGKIVAVGRAGGSGGGNFGLARYNGDGSLDTSFSGDGMQTSDFGGFDRATGVALQSDGKIVTVGRGGGSGSGDFALARYNADGSLDTSFSGDGTQTTDFFGLSDRASGVALQGDGRIVAVGRGGQSGGGGDFALARYGADGSLDASFSGDGKRTTTFGFSDQATGVALRGDGRIVAVGGGRRDFALARYNADGSLDTSLSDDGKQTTDFGGTDEARAVALQGDGRITAVGGGGGVDDFALARYNADGSLDTSFSVDGKRTTDFGGHDEASGVAVQDDGKIVVVGSGRGPISSGPFARDDFALARYNADGSLDTSFSGDGKQTTGFGFHDEATAVAVQDDGKIVVVGHEDFANFALARYNPDGSLDTSFSGDGKQTTDFGFSDEATAVALQDDGKIVAVGVVEGDETDFALARYNPNGSPDTSFSFDGRETTDFGGFNDEASGVALQGDGKIVAVGQADSLPTDDDFALARYNDNGSLDTSFSGDGKQTTDFFGGAQDRASGMAIQGDGKIIAVGVAGDDFALARYNTGGSPDTSFSGDGKQTTDFFGESDVVWDLALQGDGKIVAAGWAYGTGAGFVDFALARYNTGGSLDTSFSGDGKQTTDFFGEFDVAYGVALQGDGKIVAVGGGDGGTGGTTDFALARYLGG